MGRIKCWVNATPQRRKIFRFVRVFLTAVIPPALAFSTTWAPVVEIPLLAAATAILNVLWRQYDPLAGTSQLGRFVRVFLFTGIPQLIAVQFGDKSTAFLIAAMIAAALEFAWRQTFNPDESDDGSDTSRVG